MTDSQTTLLLRATVCHAPAGELVCHADGGLLVEDGRIVQCGDFEVIRALRNVAPITDWRGSFIVPGFVDAHVHFPQVRIIGALGHSLLDWLERIALPEEARLADANYARETAQLFVRALAANGTTTALVFGAHFSGATAALFDAADAAGLRICAGLVLSDRGLRPDLHQTPEVAYAESAGLIRRYHNRGLLRYAVTPRFALSTTEAMLEVCQTLVREHPDVLVQTHINENTSEIAELKKLFPWTGDYLGVYERFSLSGPRSVMAHNVHATDSELQRIAAAQTAVAHCPASNGMLGSGCFPMKRHLAAGVRVALGTDVGGGAGFGMLKEALHAYLMQRLCGDDVVLDAGRLLYLSTKAGAEALGLGETTGDFAAGKAADFVCLRPKPGSLLETVFQRAATVDQALSSLFTMGGEDVVREVRVAGRIVYSGPAA